MKKILLLSLAFFFFSNSHAKVLSIEVMRRSILELDKSIEKTKLNIKTVKDAKFLPDLYFALAEFLVEKAKFMYTLKVEENPNTPLDEIDFTAEKRPKYEALSVYDSIYERFPSITDRDKALFLKAHEQRELGLIEDMIVTYKLLVKKFPKSSFWPESQLIIGNYLFEEKKELELAIGVFKTISNKRESPFSSVALYKMGWCYINLNQFEKSLLSFEKVLNIYDETKFSKLPDIYKKTDIRLDTLMAMVWPYSEVTRKRLKKLGKGRHQPIQYFKKLSFNKYSYEKVLFKLAKRLGIKKKNEMATGVYYELLTLTHDIKLRVDIIERLYASAKNTLKRWPVNGYVEEVVETIPLIRVSKDFKKSEKKKYVFDFEIFSRDMATRLHERAKKTNLRSDWIETVIGYKQYLHGFNKKKYREKIELNLAEAYYKSGMKLDSAKLYENLSKKAKDQKTKKDYLNSSLQAYLEVIKLGVDQLDDLEVVEVRSGIRHVGKKYEKLFPKAKILSEIHFVVAQTYYDERNFKVAVKKFIKFIRMYPKSSRVKTAVDLVLDSYNQREDYEGLIEVAKQMLDGKYLVNANDKNNVQQIIDQAELKLVQNSADGFGSQKYSSHLLKMAEKHKGSSLGDKALYEAFMSLKSKNDFKAYGVAEELIVKHGNSKYAEDVALSITNMAMFSADFEKAAKYYEIYYEKFPKNSKAKEFLKNASMIRESMGDLKRARDNYMRLNDTFKATEMLFKSQNWVLLKSIGSKFSGLYSLYWKGLAYYRLNDFYNAEKLFDKILFEAASTEVEQEAKAHGLYILADLKIRKYKKIKMTLGNEAKSIEAKNKAFAKIGDTLKKVTETSRKGRWALAGLYGLGVTNKEFGDFIANAPIPKQLSAGDKKLYKKTLKEQAKNYWQASKGYFSECMKAAEKYLIMSHFVNGCKSKGKIKVNEAKEMVTIAKSPSINISKASRIRKKLLKSPRDTKLLMKLADLYSAKKAYPMADLILNRAISISPKDNDILARIGVVKLNQNYPQEAKFWFDKVKGNTIALHGLKRLYSKFGYSKKLQLVKKKLGGQRLPAGVFIK